MLSRVGHRAQVAAAPPSGQRLGTGIRVESLSYASGGRLLVDSIDLALEPRSLTVIMGPNGAGKSLLLRLLHGLLAPSGGRIRFGSEPAGERARACQAMVFQKPVLLRRSAAANVDYGLRSRGKADRTLRDALLEKVGLLDLARQPARLLSGGEQQRLALARALATEPAILFLDEPTASLDPASAALIESILSQFSLLGGKVVLVTHDIGQARRLAEDVVFLHRGRVCEHSAAARFFDDPASEEAAAYLGGQIVL